MPTTPAEPAPAPPEPPAEDPAPPAPAPRRPPPAFVPFLPSHVSSDDERTAFRTLAEDVWERHSAAVSRMLTRMPALRGHEQEAARADLIALHLYLHTTEGRLGHRELARSLWDGDADLLPYAACVTSALRRMPSYRGVALRGTDGTDGLAPGELLRDPAPVCMLPLSGAGPRPGGAQYAVWSLTGRRVRQLASGPGAAPRDEVVFAPGTLLRVLQVREDGTAPLILLREVSSAQGAPVAPGPELDELDRTALRRLDEALAGRPAASAPFDWPELCEGVLGRDAASAAAR